MSLRFIASSAIAFSCCLAQAQEPDADWKLYGFAEHINKKGDSAELFYSESNTTRNPNGHIEVWTKGLDEKEMERARNNASKELIERSAKRIAHYDVPVAALVMKLDTDQMTNVVLSEEIANEADVQPRIRALYELDCPQKMYRELSFSLLDKNHMGTADSPRAWGHIPPETNIAALKTLLCRPQ